ncbi:MAG: prepilin-type N-terminal cleavage/methylation domain-containing protein [Fimbriimonadaceae bacterium]|nr:prepilin-type N-terminal cleavage/methylation domain-containing protein [Fimbriimonadaceae bacterium]
MKRLAFTLIELLVVIAIIAILAAILFPVFAQAKAAAKKTAALSNVKQLGLAIIQYQADHDDYQPVPYNWSMPNGGSPDWFYMFSNDRSWDVLIRPYTGTQVQRTLPNGNREAVADGGLFTSPSDSTARRQDGNFRSRRSFGWNGSQLYGANGVNGYAGLGAVGDMDLSDIRNYFPRPLSATDYPDPAGTLVLVEKPTAENWLASVSGAFAENPGEGIWWQHAMGQQKDRNQNRPVLPLHAGQWVYTFADGHAKSLHPQRTLGPAAFGDLNSAVPFGMWTRAEGD